MHINDLLKIAVASGASDLHLKVGSYPMMRGQRQLVPPPRRKRLDRTRTPRRWRVDHVTPASARSSRTTQEVDLAYSVPGLGRFRCNVFQQRGTIGLVLRVIPTQDQDHRRARPAAGAQEDRRRGARPGARHRHHRQRQEHDAGGDDRLHQRDARRAHHDGRGPDRVPAPRHQSIVNQREVGGRHASRSRTRCAARCARTPTSSWSARCATSRRSRPRCSPPRPATWCSRRCTRSTPPRPSTASSRCSRRTSRSRSACSSRAC